MQIGKMLITGIGKFCVREQTVFALISLYRIEKDCTSWAHDRLKELFASSTTYKITSIDGDVSVNQRKGKVKQLFDLELSLDLEGSGGCRVAEFTADAEEASELEVKGFNGTGEQRKEIQRAVFEVLKKFKEELHMTHGLPLLIEASNGKGGIDGNSTVSSNSTGNASNSNSNAIASSAKPSSTILSQPSSNPPSNPSQSLTTSLSDSITFNCPAPELYHCLTDPGRVLAWSRSPSSALPQIILPGAPFSLFGGNIVGKFLELKPPHALTLEWRLKNWTAASKVQISIAEESSSSCRVELEHQGVPEGEVERIRENWHNYYWTPIKRMIGQL